MSRLTQALNNAIWVIKDGDMTEVEARAAVVEHYKLDPLQAWALRRRIEEDLVGDAQDEFDNARHPTAA